MEYGEWRQVPGFDPSHVLVSSMGWVKLRGPGGTLSIPRLGYQKENGYMRVGIQGRLYLVHKLVAAAFLPMKTAASCTVDHIAKYNGDFKRERSDNRATNLRWATPTEQVINRKANVSHRNSRAVVAWKLGEGKDTVYHFATSAEAAKKLTLQTGVQFYSSSIRRVCTGEVNHSCGYVFKYDESMDEPQHIDGEEWKESIWSPLLLVSNLGRVQLRHRHKNAIGLRFTPLPGLGEDYARVASDKKDYYVHRLVYYTFHADCLENSEPEVIDHIDSDKSNNALSNLQGITFRENSLKATRKANEESHEVLKQPVEGRCAESNDEWEWFASQLDAARILTGRLGKTVRQGKISRSISKGYKHRGYTFRKAARRTPTGAPPHHTF